MIPDKERTEEEGIKTTSRCLLRSSLVHPSLEFRETSVTHDIGRYVAVLSPSIATLNIGRVSAECDWTRTYSKQQLRTKNTHKTQNTHTKTDNKQR